MAANSGVELRPFRTSEWREYRELRLAALKDSPDAFGSTFEGANLLSDAEWEDRLARVVPALDFPVAVRVDGEFVGMAWVKIGNPADETAHLYQMWVSPVCRGRGIGRTILDAALQWARDRRVKRLILGVTCGDRPARRLYESAGFEPTGKPEPLRPGSALEVQTMIFEFSDTRAA